MSQETLKVLRFFIPGLMATIALEPVLRTASLIARFDLPDIAAYPLPVFVFGLVYYVLELRRLTFERPVNEINQNIKESLLACCKDRSELLAAGSILREGRKLMIVFYKIVDSDPTLSEKAKRVRFNGLIWSSLADVQVVGAIGAVVYLVAAAIRASLANAVTSLVLLGVVALARWGLMPRTTRKHLELSNEQLEVIAQEHRQDVCDRIEALVNSSS